MKLLMHRQLTTSFSVVLCRTRKDDDIRQALTKNLPTSLNLVHNLDDIVAFKMT